MLLIYLMFTIIPSTGTSLISTKLEITQLLPLIDKANNWNILLFKETYIIKTHRPSLKCGLKASEEFSCFEVFSEKSFSKRLYHQLVEFSCKPVDWLLYVACFYRGLFQIRLFEYRFNNFTSVFRHQLLGFINFKDILTSL